MRVEGGGEETVGGERESRRGLVGERVGGRDGRESRRTGGEERETGEVR